MAQVGEPPLWMLEQFLLSAAASKPSNFSPRAIPLVTSFLMSELATFVPLTSDLFGGCVAGDSGAEEEVERSSGYALQAQTPGITTAHRARQRKSRGLSMQFAQFPGRKQAAILQTHP